MTCSFKAVIPARYGSTRLPGKPLVLIGGRTLLQHAYEAARASRAERVIIATDDLRIERSARDFGAEVMMTSPRHASGTDRIAEVAARLGEPDDAMIVDVQGDWLGLPPELVDQVAGALQRHPGAAMATLCGRIESEEEWRDPNAVKVVLKENGSAAYFSRSCIPWRDRAVDGEFGFRHIGLYAYRAGFLRWFAATPPCDLELRERLEQLRALYHGHVIHVELARTQMGIEVNSPEDLQRARAF